MLSMGLARVAVRRAVGVQTCKKGPDFIDPVWVNTASFKPCYNLDPYLQSDDQLQRTYTAHTNDAVFVEGTMGLHDGLSVDGSDSNAAIAKQLGLPVLLVIDCGGMHRTIASLVNGIVQFDPELTFSGLILNRIRSDRHAGKIERAITEYCDVGVLGVIPECADLQLDERELGLVPAPDYPLANDHIDFVADTLAASCNLDALFQRNASRDTAESLKNVVVCEGAAASTCSLTIGIAQDEAFHFYYEDDLDTLRARGVQLVPFSPLHDPFPANVDGVLIGGGFPERHAAALSENTSCRKGLASAIANGLPVRAECGGLMYVCQSISVDNVVWPMTGAINGAVTMQPTPRGRGYMKLAFSSSHSMASECANTLTAHEFHHSAITFDTPPEFAYQVTRGYGVDGKHDGVCVNNVIASYAHFRHTDSTPWIDWFLGSVQRSKLGANQKIHHV